MEAGRPPGELLATLLERIAQAHAASEACGLALDGLLGDSGIPSALLLLDSARGVRAFSWGLPEPQRHQLARAAADPELDLLARARAKPAVERVPAELSALGCDRCAFMPLGRANGRARGLLVLATDRLDERTVGLAETLGRCAPSLLRLVEVEELRTRGSKLERQRDLLTSIINGLSDPVLLTDEGNDILLANRRAEQLFSTSPEDSEGRRRAIEVNNLLFSSFLTRSVISGPDGAGRELNLVDPSDGSDLLFEVLSVPLSGEVAAGGAVISILRNITDLKRALTELESALGRSRAAEHQSRRESERLNMVLENVVAPILVTDAESNIILMNREAERLFVVPAPGAQEARARRVVQANDTKFTTLISRFLLQPERRWVNPLELTDPDTERVFPAEVVSSKILDRRGEPTAIVSVLHDQTQVVENQRLAKELQELNRDLEGRIRDATVELEEHNRRLAWQSRELEKAYRLKSEFLASMSHELRTPINVIIGYTSLLRDRIYGELRQSQEEALDKIHATSAHLLELINDILDLSKIEAGKMPVHPEEVRIGELVAELSATIEPMVQRKPLQYRAEVDDDLPVLWTDRTKLKQVLLNLLSNAIKFTPEGMVELRAGKLPDERCVRLLVRDSGIGIKPEHLATIFEDFRQVDQSPTREYGGTGLGLSITKKLLTLLGGRISVESTYGEGSTFVVDLPVAARPGTLEEQVRRATVDSDQSVVKG